MVSATTRPWNACSANSMAIIAYPDDSEDALPCGTYTALTVEEEQYPIACIEVQTAVLRNSLDQHILNLEVDLDM